MAVTQESRRLIERSLSLSLSRRHALQAMAAGAGVSALGATGASALFAQATPEAETAAAYDGPLADEQLMRLPMSEPVTMDPGASTGFDELAIFFNIYEGLTRVDQQTGEIVGGVAESWEVSEDVTEFTFTLKPGLQWSDGTPLTANDFVYSWRRVLDPNTLSEYVPAMFYLLNGEEIANGEAELDALGVEAVDDTTLKVTLSNPLAFFPLIAATWTYMPVPQHIIEEHGDSWTDTGEVAVSNGPYVMESWDHDQKIVLVANPNYTSGDPVTVQRAEYSIFSDPTTQAYIAFENDELDYAAPEGPDLDRVLADPELAAALLRFPLSNCNFIVCDTRGEFTGQIPFRQALYKAVNRDDLAKIVLREQYLPAYTIISPDIPGSLLDESPINESVDEAKQLLADAGIDPAAVTLEITYQNSPARIQIVAEYLQATWQEVLGITVTLAPIEESTYTDWRAGRETQGFDVYTGSWGSDFADPSNWHNQNFTSQANHYRSHWLNEEYDSLATAALVESDPETRAATYQDAERILVEEAPIIPLYRGLAARAVKPHVKDIYLQPTLSFVHLRTIKIAAKA
jgi:oligopeptide transport system substrate-binding protein